MTNVESKIAKITLMTKMNDETDIKYKNQRKPLTLQRISRTPCFSDEYRCLSRRISSRTYTAVFSFVIRGLGYVKIVSHSWGKEIGTLRARKAIQFISNAGLNKQTNDMMLS